MRTDLKPDARIIVHITEQLVDDSGAHAVRERRIVQPVQVLDPVGYPLSPYSIARQLGEQARNTVFADAQEMLRGPK